MIKMAVRTLDESKEVPVETQVEAVTEMMGRHKMAIMEENLPLTDVEKSEELARRMNAECVEKGYNYTIDFIEDGNDVGAAIMEKIMERLNINTPLQMMAEHLEGIMQAYVTHSQENGGSPMKDMLNVTNGVIHVMASVLDKSMPSVDANFERTRQLLWRTMMMSFMQHSMPCQDSCLINRLNVKKDELMDDYRAVMEGQTDDRLQLIIKEYRNLVELFAMPGKTH